MKKRKAFLAAALCALCVAAAACQNKIIKIPEKKTADVGASEVSASASVSPATEDPTGSATETPEQRVGVSGVTLSSSSLELKVGQTAVLTATVLPLNATDRSVIFRVSDESVLTCENGRLSALKEGSAVVTVETHEDGYIARCTVTVTDQPEPTPSIETPTPSVETPTPSIETPTPSVETPTPSVETPTPSIETPTPSVETPTPSVETPTPSVETPTPSIETPTPSVETPTPSVETPTPSTETPTPTVSPTVPPENPLEYKHYAYDFQVDLSEYEQYMDPQGNGYLILVDAAHPLSSKDIPSDLVSCVNTRKDGRTTQRMRLYAAKAMEALYLEADAAGMLYKNEVEGHGSQILSLTTAYRSYYDQEYLFKSYIENEKKNYPDMSEEEIVALVKTYSCPPGTSEHQTGLCTDMHNWPTAGRYMAKEFAASPAGQWLRENCYKFGFILRFPEDKTEITGITFESWHFRYVGRYHATRMHELNMCLEEYLAYLTQFGYKINEGLE